MFSCTGAHEFRVSFALPITFHPPVNRAKNYAPPVGRNQMAASQLVTVGRRR